VIWSTDFIIRENGYKNKFEEAQKKQPTILVQTMSLRREKWGLSTTLQGNASGRYFHGSQEVLCITQHLLESIMGANHIG